MQTLPLRMAEQVSPALYLARLSPPREQISAQIVCVPPTAGGFFSFLPWLKTPSSLHPLVPADVELWGVQLEWTAEWKYDALVSTLTDALEAQHTSDPLVLCGASLGGLLAFSVARELRRRQAQAPLGLVVLAMRAPQGYQPIAGVEHWAPDEWRTELRRVGGTPEEVLTDSARLAHLVAQLRGGQAIARDFRYTAEPPFAFPMATFVGEQDQEFAPHTLEGWRALTTSTYTPFVYPEAGHLDLLQVPAIRWCVLVDMMTTVQHWLEVAA